MKLLYYCARKISFNIIINYEAIICFFIKSNSLLLILITISLPSYSQNTISGKVTESESNVSLPGVNIVILGKTGGTITDENGNFTLSTNTELPFTLEFSFIGYKKKQVQVTTIGQNINVSLEAQSFFADEIVISASRVEEKLLESPVSIEKISPEMIKNTAAPDFYERLDMIRGVTVTKGSLTLSTINTRGFATASNVRFVQLQDGVDNAAPILNFPTGNIVGMSELDVHSMELVPGAASALYGPNAFNGILLMKSKNPFDYQGLSVALKGGINSSDKFGNGLYNQVALRYAKSFLGNKLAFKLNFSYLNAREWEAGDNQGIRNSFTNPNGSAYGSPNFDGLNTYGDEPNIPTLPLSLPEWVKANFETDVTTGVTAQVNAGIEAQVTAEVTTAVEAAVPAGTPNRDAVVADRVAAGVEAQLPVALSTNAPGLIANGVAEQLAFIGSFGNLDISRTGFKETDLLSNNTARSIKGNGALHFKPSDNSELSYTFNYGSGRGIYQGSERYHLNDFAQMSHKLEFNTKNLMAT